MEETLFESENKMSAYCKAETTIDEYVTHVPSSDCDEVGTAISHLENNKATGTNGLPTQLFKYGGKILES